MDHDRELDLVFMCKNEHPLDTSFLYLVGFSFNPVTGRPRESGPLSGVVDPWATLSDGGGMEIGDFDRDGELEIVLMTYAGPEGQNAFIYERRVLTRQGTAAKRIGIEFLLGLGHLGDGAGLTDGDGWLDLLLMAYDDPQGDNGFRDVVHHSVIDPEQGAQQA